jgi:hypothetical protein
MKSMYEYMLKTSRVLDIGERHIVMATKDYGRGKPRFVINLPTTRNDLWIYLWQRKVPVKIFIELPEDLTKYEKEYRSAEKEE